MSLFRTIVFVAAVAGAIAGLALTAIQHASTVPLILKAETFEAKAAPAHAAHDHGAAGTHDHGDHQHEGWSPADGVERIAYTTLANVVGGDGPPPLLVPLSGNAGGPSRW